MRRILFIDNQVPLFDQSAGARSTLLYLKLFKSMGHDVTFFAYDSNAEKSYTKKLLDLGVKIRLRSNNKILWRLRIFWDSLLNDVVFLNRPDITRNVIRYLAPRSLKRSIYQCHDLHCIRLQRENEITKDSSINSAIIRYREIEKYIYKRIHTALTFSSFEKEIIEKEFGHSRTHVVPLLFFDESPPAINDFANRKNLLFVGGFNHSPNIDAVLWLVNEIIPKVKIAIPNINLYVVGSNTPDSIKSLSSDSVKIFGRVDDQKIDEIYSSIRMVVVPLRYGAGVKGKVIEAIQKRIPLVSTTIGIEGIPELGSILKPSDTAADFASEIVRTYLSENFLRRMSIDFDCYAKKHFSLQGVRELMGRILEAAACRA